MYGSGTHNVFHRSPSSLSELEVDNGHQSEGMDSILQVESANTFYLAYTGMYGGLLYIVHPILISV